ncbi:MAG: MATE family efflux transporter [Oscillospiraceae bacterium]|nr:MATE family efflux transporter [Oscillospiraceae bacterium]
MTAILRRVFSCRYMLKPGQQEGVIPPSREVYKRNLSIAWPAALESTLVGLIAMVDTIMVGGLGSAAIAAVGITNQPKMIFLALINSLNVAVTVVIARRKGEGDQIGVIRCMKQSILISMALSLLLTVAGVLFAQPILRLAGAGDDIIGDATAYLQIIMAGFAFNTLSMTINAAQRGVGNTRLSMRSNVVANICNVIFNYLLINGIWFFPRLEVRGAALASVLGSMVALGMAVRSLFHHNGFLYIGVKAPWSFQKTNLLTMSKIASSAMVEQVFMRIGFFAYAAIVAGLGTVSFATHQICMNILGLVFYVADGFGIATSSLVGQSLGAKRKDMALIYAKVGQRIALLVGLLMSLICVALRTPIIMMFSREADVVQAGAFIMLIIGVISPIDTCQVVVSGCLRGAGDNLFIALTSLISIAFVRPVLSWLLCYPLGIGLVGAWIGVLADQTLRFLINFARLSSGKWTQKVV